jgi:hypothetical protein
MEVPFVTVPSISSILPFMGYLSHARCRCRLAQSQSRLTRA